MSQEWIDKFVSVLTDVMNNKGGTINWKGDNGMDITVKISANLYQMILANKDKFAEIGKDNFQEFLKLLSKKQNFDALVLIYDKLDNSALLEQYKNDSEKLAEIAQKTQDTRDFWIAFAKQVAMKMLSFGLSALLASL